MKHETPPVMSGELLDDERELTVHEFCAACGLETRRLEQLIRQGIVRPRGRGPESWRFAAVSVQRARRAVRLRRDLGVNWAGAALALELIDELHSLRAQLAAARR